NAIETHRWEYVCVNCRSTRRQQQQADEQAEAQIEQQRLQRIIAKLSNEDVTCDYEDVDYFDAVAAYGIMSCSETAIVDGAVGNPYQLALCPTDSLLSKLLARLYNSKILIFPYDTSTDAIDSEDPDGLSFYPLRVNWQFAPPAFEESFSRAFRQLNAVVDLRTEHPQYNDAVSELWWLLALDEIKRYLDEQLRQYRLPEPTLGPKLKEDLTYALNRFSIPQVRNLLYHVAKNTAALASRRDFTKLHALNTIPGGIIRYCDRALADKWNIKPYCLKWEEE